MYVLYAEPFLSFPLLYFLVSSDGIVELSQYFHHLHHFSCCLLNLQEKRLSKTSSLHGRHYMHSLYGLRVSSFGMIQVRDHSAIAWFQIERGSVQVSLLWDKQHEIHMVRKSTQRLCKCGVDQANIEQDTAICKLENHFYKRCTCMDCQSHPPYIYLFCSI